MSSVSGSLVGSEGLKIQEIDGSPAGFPSVLKVSNGTLTDNGDGSFTVTTGGGGGGGTPGGSTTQVQFNDAGAFAGNSAFTFDKTTKNLSLVSSTPGTSLAGIGSKGFEVSASDNTVGGVGTNTSNTNAGTSAYVGYNLYNNLANDNTFTHYAGLFYNSSAYTDTSFGTSAAIANQFAMVTTDGPIMISTTVVGANAYANIVLGGAATTNEVARFTTAGLTVGLAGTLSGAIKFAGLTSGGLTVTAPSVAGSGTLTLPVKTDTIAVIGNTIKTAQFTANSNTTGKQTGFYTCPCAGNITAWSFAVNSGATATVKVWKVATGTAAPTVSNNINTSGVSISSNTYVRSTTLSDFTTTAVAAGDIIAFNLTAAAGVTDLTFQIEITPN